MNEVAVFFALLGSWLLGILSGVFMYDLWLDQKAESYRLKAYDWEDEETWGDLP